MRAVLKPRSVAYGYSMGAYGALKHGARLGIGAAVAVAPQVSIAPTDVPADARFHRFFRPGLHRGMRVAAADLAPFVAVLADPYDAQDWAHARLAAAAGSVHLLPTPHAGHAAIWLVAGTEALAQMLGPVLDRDIAGMRAMLRARRAGSGHWFRLMGRAAWSHGHARLAQTLWDRAGALGIPPAVLAQERATAAVERAQRLIALGRRAEAVETCRALVREAAPGDASLGQAAHLLLAAGAPAEAEAAFRAALAALPEAGDLHAGLSLALAGQGRGREALEAARAGHAALPQHADLATHYAHLLRGEGHDGRAEAERIFRAVLARDPGTGLAHYGLSVLLADRGAAPEALHQAERAVARLPGHHEALDWLAGLALRAGDAPRAERLYRRLQRQAADRPAGYLGLAAALCAQDRRAEAVGALRRGLSALPGNADLAARLADLTRGPGGMAGLVARLRRVFGRPGSRGRQ